MGKREYKCEHKLVGTEVEVLEELDCLGVLEDQVDLLHRHHREVLGDQRGLEVPVDHHVPLVLQGHRVGQEVLRGQLVLGDQGVLWDHQDLEVQGDPWIHQDLEDREVELVEQVQEVGEEEVVDDSKRENMLVHSAWHNHHHKDVELDFSA